MPTGRSPRRCRRRSRGSRRDRAPRPLRAPRLTSIEAVRGDIAAFPADAIVNAANESLQLGAGVAGAIRRAGGPSIQRECDRIGRCPTGEAVSTPAGDLPARWVIHAVGPVWGGGASREDELLDSAVTAALARAEELGAASVALPALSTGIYGFPLERAARISVAAARRFAESARAVRRIVFVLFDQRALDGFEREIEGAKGIPIGH